MYYFLISILYIFSILPMRILYLFADIAYFLIYQVIGYRKKVVAMNINNSFPHLNELEKKQIESDFYHNFCDYIFETIKLYTISGPQLLKRIQFSPEAISLFDHYESKSQNFILVMGHQFNWEWAGCLFGVVRKQPLSVIYHPLSNPAFERIMMDIRTRFGAKAVPMRDTFKQMLQDHQIGGATVFIADQTPPPEGAYWTQFLHQDTPIFNGTEKIAQKLNLPVIGAYIIKQKRGQYIVDAQLLCDHPKGTDKGAISELHTRSLEAVINKYPANWLWSHRRWKHKRKK